MKKPKYIYVNLKERNGEKEYGHPVALKVPSTSTPEKTADKYAKDFWGENTGKRDGWYEFDNGCIMVRVREIKPITKAEYELLSKFI